MSPIACRECGHVYEGKKGAPCPRCAKIDAALPSQRQDTPVVGIPHVVPQRKQSARLERADEAPPPVVIPGPPSPLANTLAQTSAPAPKDDFGMHDLDVLERYKATESDTMVCPRCAETIKRAAKMCRFCQLDLLAPWRSSAPPPPVQVNVAAPEPERRTRSGWHETYGPSRMIDYAPQPRANPGLAVGLSFLICGLGQAYAGDVGRGVVVFFGAVVVGFLTAFMAFTPGFAVGYLVMWLAGFAYWIWNMVDAYNVAASPEGVSRPVRAWWRKRRRR